MRWLKPNLRNSIYAMFSQSHAPASSQPAPADIGMEDIRDSMLALLTGSRGDHAQHVTRRIRHARDVQGLWFLRGDLMAVLAASHGETAAWEMIGAVSGMFENLLPEGLRSRPSPLCGYARH